MMQTRLPLRALCGAMTFWLLVAALPAPGEQLPEWPADQQDMLRQVEDRVIEMQRKVFAARQRGDQSALATYSQQYQELQEKRRVLIELTKNQLPSD